MLIHHYERITVRVPFRPGRRARLTIASDGPTVRIRRLGRTRRHLALCRRAHRGGVLVTFDVKPLGGSWESVRIVACARCGATLTDDRDARL